MQQIPKTFTHMRIYDCIDDETHEYSRNAWNIACLFLSLNTADINSSRFVCEVTGDGCVSGERERPIAFMLTTPPFPDPP